jgi:hypothetical protein
MVGDAKRAAFVQIGIQRKRTGFGPIELMRAFSLRSPLKCLPLLCGQKLEESRHRVQRHLRISVVQIGRAAVSIACSVTGIWLL